MHPPVESAAETGSPQAIHALYNDHHGWLHGWLRRKLGCTEQAADLAHDIFIRIMVGRNMATINEPRAYLTRVAKGILINGYQRQALERAYLEALAQLPEPEVPSPEPAPPDHGNPA